jgi:hypothetical protein
MKKATKSHSAGRSSTASPNLPSTPRVQLRKNVNVVHNTIPSKKADNRAREEAPIVVSRVFNTTKFGELHFLSYTRELNETAESSKDDSADSSSSLGLSMLGKYVDDDIPMMKVTINKAMALQYQQQLRPPMRHVRCEQSTSVNIKDFVSPAEKPYAWKPYKQNYDIKRWVN